MDDAVNVRQNYSWFAVWRWPRWMQAALVAAVLLMPVAYLLSLPAVEYLLASRMDQLSPGMDRLITAFFYPAILCAEFLPLYPKFYEYEFSVLCDLFGHPENVAPLDD